VCVCVCVSVCMCVMRQCCAGQCRAAVSIATDMGVRYGTKRVAFTVCVLRHCCAASDVVRNIDRYRYGGEKWHQACGLDIFLS
jgi:hypothetical protein